jgi:hypothetical protein
MIFSPAGYDYVIIGLFIATGNDPCQVGGSGFGAAGLTRQPGFNYIRGSKNKKRRDV